MAGDASGGLPAPLLEGGSNGDRSGPYLGCIPCHKLTIWRAEGSNRPLWKSICTGVLLAEFCVYFYLVWSDVNRVLLVGVGVLTLAKFLVEIWGQDTPTWLCPGGLVMFVVIYVGIVPGIVYMAGYCSADKDISFPGSEVVGVAMFLGGSAYSLVYEVGRFQWKKKPENRGRLHTIGLASYCIHPNYFGDLFTYSGWGILAGTSCALSMPTGMLWSFVYLVIPNADAYLATRYAAQWPEYASKTGTLIPFVFSSMAMRLLAWVGLALSLFLSGSCAGQCSREPA